MDSVFNDLGQPRLKSMPSVEDDAPYSELERLVARVAKEWLTFERLCQEMRNRAAPDPRTFSATDRDVERTVLSMLHPSRPAGERERTLVALLRAVGSHPDIAPLRYLLKDEHSVPDSCSEHSLQAMLEARDDVFAHWYRFKEGMERAEMAVCQVHINRMFKGTGFLISESHVLTTFHGIGSLVGPDDRPLPDSHTSLRFVFDDVLIPGMMSSTYRVEVLAARDWLVCSSRFDQAEDASKTPLDRLQAGLLDFAVIRLAEPVGNTAPKYQKGVVRGWIRLDNLAVSPQPTTQMLIAHFPAGADLRLCVGLFGVHSECSSRVRYLTPVVLGSSGAPCFNIEWKPYALHNAGYPAVPINQGVPLALIRDAIDPALLAAAIAAKPPFIPAVLPDGKPILGRPDLADVMESGLSGQSAVSVLVITSEEKGGKSFTADLIRAALMDRGHSAFLLDAETFAADTPEMFAKRLVETIAGVEHAGLQPAAPDNRQRARWITYSLSEWTKSRALEEGQKRRAEGGLQDSSLWIILDRCDKVVFTQETHDLLLALIGDESGTAQPLRFVLLGYEGGLASIPIEKVWRTRLNLMSATGALPFMEHTMAALGQQESSDTLYTSATVLVESAHTWGISTIPGFAAGLETWANNRKAPAAAAATASGAQRSNDRTKQRRAAGIVGHR